MKTKHALQMLLAKHTELARIAISKLDEKEHAKQLKEIDKIREELKKYEN